MLFTQVTASYQKTGACSIIWQGGFWLTGVVLSAFVEQCEKAGITFIGPPPKAMDALGDKLHSKVSLLTASIVIFC